VIQHLRSNHEALTSKSFGKRQSVREKESEIEVYRERMKVETTSLE
jgi:hypothetical protein